MKIINKKIIWSLIIIAILIILISISKIYKIISQRTAGVISQSKSEIIPENIFDTKVKIPGTSVFISYPKNGFYGLGIKEVTETSGDSFNGLGFDIKKVMETSGNRANEFPKKIVVSKADYDPKKISAGVTLMARGLHHLSKDETFRTFMDSHFIQVKKAQELMMKQPHNQDSPRYPSSGRYITINGREFSISKWEDGLTYWEAFTEVNGNIIYVTIGYTFMPTDDPILRAQSTAAYENNDKLFLQILSHLQFE